MASAPSLIFMVNSALLPEKFGPSLAITVKKSFWYLVAGLKPGAFVEAKSRYASASTRLVSSSSADTPVYILENTMTLYFTEQSERLSTSMKLVPLYALNSPNLTCKEVGWLMKYCKSEPWLSN